MICVSTRESIDESIARGVVPNNGFPHSPIRRSLTLCVFLSIVCSSKLCLAESFLYIFPNADALVATHNVEKHLEVSPTNMQSFVEILTTNPCSHISQSPVKIPIKENDYALYISDQQDKSWFGFSIPCLATNRQTTSDYIGSNMAFCANFWPDIPQMLNVGPLRFFAATDELDIDCNNCVIIRGKMEGESIDERNFTVEVLQDHREVHDSKIEIIRQGLFYDQYVGIITYWIRPKVLRIGSHIFEPYATKETKITIRYNNSEVTHFSCNPRESSLITIDLSIAKKLE